MNKTTHIFERMQQRGISEKMISMIMNYGTPVRKQGGVVEFRIIPKIKQRLISDLKKQIQLIDKLSSKGVLVDLGDDTIVTTYHLR